MPHVVVLTSGGTIASRRSGGAVVAVDDGSAVLAGIEFDDGTTVEQHEVLRVGSYLMTLADMRTIAEAVARQLERDDVDGVVITHGTDTLEETAILLDLVHRDSRGRRPHRGATGRRRPGHRRAAQPARRGRGRGLSRCARPRRVGRVQRLGAGRARRPQVAHPRPGRLLQPGRHGRRRAFGRRPHARHAGAARRPARPERLLRRHQGRHRRHLPER